MDLLKELRRTSATNSGALPSIPHFNDDLVHQTLESIETQFNGVLLCSNKLQELEQESELMNSQISEISEIDRENRVAVNELQMEDTKIILELKHNEGCANVRALSIYQKERMDRIRKIKWGTGSTALPGHINENMSSLERAWYTNYDKHLRKLSSNYNGLDLNSDLEPPSTANLITVKCNVEIGALMLSNGTSVTFEENMIYTLPRNLIENYIRLGQLEPI